MFTAKSRRVVGSLLLSIGLIGSVTPAVPAVSAQAVPDREQAVAQPVADRVESPDPRLPRPAPDGGGRAGEAGESTGQPAFSIDPDTGRTVWDLPAGNVVTDFGGAEIVDGKPIAPPKVEVVPGFVPGESQYLPDMSDPTRHVFLNPDHTITAVYTDTASEIDTKTGVPFATELVGEQVGDVMEFKSEAFTTRLPVASLENARVSLIEAVTGDGERFTLDVVGQNTRTPGRPEVAAVPVTPGRGVAPDVGGKPESPGRVGFDDLLDGVDVTVTPTPEGAKLDFVAATAEAAAGIVEQVTVPAGWSFKAEGGAIVLVDPDGVAGGIWAGGIAFDANGENETAVWLELGETNGTTATARVMVDPEWLKDPKVAFPVTIDPVINIGALNDTWVEQNNTSNNAGSQYLRAGMSGSLPSRSYIKFDDSWFTFGSSNGWRIDSAQLHLFNFYSNTCGSHATYARRVTSAWTPSSTVWTNRPSAITTGQGSTTATYGGSGCGDNWLDIDVTGPATYWGENPGTNHGLEIASTETTGAAFKQFYSNDYAGSGYRPYMTINYETYGAYYTPDASFGGANNDLEDVLLPIPGTAGTAADGRFPMSIANRGVLNWPSGTPVETLPQYQVCASYHVNANGTPAPPSTWAGYLTWLVSDGARTCPTVESNMADKFANPATVTNTDVAMLIALRGTDRPSPGLFDVYFSMVHENYTWFEIEGNPLAAKQQIRWTAPPRVTNIDSGAVYSVDEAITLNLDKPYDTGTTGAWTPSNYRVKWSTTPGGFTDANALTVTGTSVTIPTSSLSDSPGPLYLCVQARDGVNDLTGGPEYWTQCNSITIHRTSGGMGASPLTEHYDGVNAASGNFYQPFTDFSPAGVAAGFGLTRHFNSANDDAGIFGPGFTTAFEGRVATYPPTFGTAGCEGTPTSGDCSISVLDADGARHAFTWDTATSKWVDGAETPTTGVITGTDAFVVTYKDGTTKTFDDFFLGEITKIVTAEGNELSITLDPTKLYNPSLIKDEESGRTIQLFYTTIPGPPAPTYLVERARMVVDGVNLDWTYQYTNGFMTKACDPRGYCTSYGWYDHDSNAGTPNRLRSITTPNNDHPTGPDDQTILGYNMTGLVTTITNPAGDTTSFAYPSTTTTTVTDARTNVWTLTFDQQNRTKTITAPSTGAGTSVTTYEYEGAYRTKITDGTGRIAQLDYDDDGNLLSESKTDGTTSETTWYSYTPSAYGNPNVITGPSRVCDARSSGATDTTYCTSFTYDAYGNKLSEQAADENTTTRQDWVYTNGTAITGDAGIPPVGLVRYHRDGNTSAQGGEGVTTYNYNTKGDLIRTVDPAGLVTVYTYDSLGRKLTETITYTDDGNTVSATTTLTYDNNSNLKTITGPTVTNPVTSTVHRLRTTYTYDANNNTTSQFDADIIGNDPDREWTRVFDVLDREYQTFDPEGEVTSREFDANGNVTAVIDPAGNRIETSYDARNQPTTVTAKAFDDGHGVAPADRVLSNYSYDQAGRVDIETMHTSASEAVVTDYGYDHAGRRTTTSINIDGTWVTVAADTYTGGYLTQSVGGNTAATAAQDKAVTTMAYYPNGLLHTSTTAGRTTTYTYDTAGNPTSVTITGTDGYDASVTTKATTTIYDSAGRPVDVRNLNSSGDDARTTTVFDQRGNAVSVIGPLGYATGANPQDHRTDVRYDRNGRIFETTEPAVAYQEATTSTGIEAGWASGTAMPTTLVGYNTFGDATHTQDPNGNTTVTAYDDNGRRTGVTHPTYTPPTGTTVTPTEAWTYDNNGNVIAYTSRNGNTTTYTFDSANRATLVTEPQLPTPDNDTVLQAAGITQTFYDYAGRVTSTITPEGATTANVYDELGRVTSTTMAVRAIADQPAMTATSTTEHSWLGYVTSSTNGAGVVTTATYDSFGNPLTTQVGALTATTMVYDGLGRARKVTDPASGITITTYDDLGHPVTVEQQDTSNVTQRFTTSTYDPAGNVLTVTDGRGAVASYSYDPASRLTTVTGPTSIVTSYGYDRAGNLTIQIDGETNPTRYTYNVWNLPEITLEPSATISPVEPEADRRWTVSYDAAGLAVREAHPGGRVVTRVFNALGLPEVETSTEPGSGTVGKTWGYDRDRRPVQLSHPDAPIVFTYDDRGLMVASAGGAGESTTVYDEAGRVVLQTDESGTTGYTYDSNGQVDEITGSPGAGDTATIRAGMVVGYTGTGTPAGWVEADGSTLTQATYPDLFAAIGHTYSPGTDPVTFDVPDYRGQALVGQSAAHTEFDVLGETGGQTTVTLTIAEIAGHTHTQTAHNHTQTAHNHTQTAHGHTGSTSTAGAHTHRMGWDGSPTGSGNAFLVSNYGQRTINGGGFLNTTGSHTHAATIYTVVAQNLAATATNNPATAINNPTGGGQAHNNLQPYGVLRWLIATDNNAAIVADMIVAYAGTTVPAGWNTTSDPGLGFLTGRTPVGQDTTQTEFDVIGETGGETDVTLTVDQIPSHTHTQLAHNHSQVAHNHTQAPHNHTASLGAAGAHTHNVGWNGGPGGSSNAFWIYNTGRAQDGSGFVEADGNHSHTLATSATTANNNPTTAVNQSTTAVNQPTGGGQAHNNLQPYATIQWLQADTAASTLAAGMVLADAAPAAALDDAWLTGDGQYVSKNNYPELFATLDDTWGNDTSSLFALPELDGRLLVDHDPSVPAFDTIGETGGEIEHVLTIDELPSHTHTQDPHTHSQNPHDHGQNAHSHTGGTSTAGNHSHLAGWNGSPGGSGNALTLSNFGRVPNGSNFTSSAGNHTHAVSVGSATATNYATTAQNMAATAVNETTGGSEGHTNLQPYTVVNWVVAVRATSVLANTTPWDITYTHNTVGQTTGIDYGNGGTRTLTYNSVGQLATDTLTNGATTTASVTYNYDCVGQLTATNLNLPGNTGAGLNTYTYDTAGRLTSWNPAAVTPHTDCQPTGQAQTPPTPAGTIYTYDNAGNRLTAGTNTFTYDDRNRLTTDPDGTYTWHPDGTLNTYTPTSGPAETYDFDPAGRLTEITDGTTTTGYTYDALDRIAERNTQPFTYTGAQLDPTGDATNTYTRTPSGRLASHNDPTNGQTFPLTNTHGDLIALE